MSYRPKMIVKKYGPVFEGRINCYLKYWKKAHVPNAGFAVHSGEAVYGKHRYLHMRLQKSFRILRLNLEKEDNGCKYAQMDLTGKYTGNDENEEAACEFLDSKRGCVLSDEDKPFDCKIWPLRIMARERSLLLLLRLHVRQ